MESNDLDGGSLMSRYSAVYTIIWRDEKFSVLAEYTKLLFLYLLTSPHGNMLGLYYLPPAYAMDDLKWTTEKWEENLKILQDNGMVQYDHERRLVFITKYLSYNRLANENQVKGAMSALLELPATPFKDLLIDAAMEYSAGSLAEAHVYRYLMPLRSPLKAPSKPLPQDTEEASKPLNIPEEALSKKETETETRTITETNKDAVVVFDKPDIKKNVGPSSLEELMARYTDEEKREIEAYWDMIRHTRQTGKLSVGVIQKWMDYVKQFDKDLVMQGIRRHMASYQDKKENYTQGIIRNLQDERKRGVQKYGYGYPGPAQRPPQPQGQDYRAGRLGKRALNQVPPVDERDR